MAPTDPIPRYTLYLRPCNDSVSPGLSVTPENKLPSMTACAPAASALMISPEYLIPPSAITGTPYFSASSAQSWTAVICGTPTPATTRVVQIDPGPIPTLTIDAPALISSFVASFVATFPAVMASDG